MDRTVTLLGWTTVQIAVVCENFAGLKKRRLARSVCYIRVRQTKPQKETKAKGRGEGGKIEPLLSSKVQLASLA